MAAATQGDNIPRPWLDNYAAGVSKTIGEYRYASIGDLIAAAAARYVDLPAYTCMGKTISYRELLAQSEKVSAFLLAKGLKKGDRVAIMLPNVLQFPIVLTGILRAGMVVVNVNPLYTPRELEYQLKDSGARAIFVLENFAHTVEQVMAATGLEHVVVTNMGEQMGGLKGMIVNLVVRKVKKLVPKWSIPNHVGYTAMLEEGAKLPFKPVEQKPEDYAFLQYTGGTTGVSKGATLTHGNVLANAEQNLEWLKAKSNLPDNLLYICALPLYHIFALTVNAIMGMDNGAHNILIPNPRDIPGFVKELAKYRFNVFPGLNTLFNALLNNADFAKLDFSGLILTLGGGMAVQKPVAERWKSITGCNIHEGYGLSETSPVASANRFDSTEFTGTIGLPLPSTDIVILDDDGKRLDFGAVGEICIRGPQVMAGYWNRPDETAKVMTSDGFFRSGDMGFMNEKGYIKIVDRKKDMILVSGFNVYPNEIEEVMVAHPGILEAAAIGIVDEHSGEAVKLFVVTSDPAVSEADVREWAKENLTNYKRPKTIEFRKELPKSAVGKILRRELRESEAKGA